jgi:hypothetical protein
MQLNFMLQSWNSRLQIVSTRFGFEGTFSMEFCGYVVCDPRVKRLNTMYLERRNEGGGEQRRDDYVPAA